MLKALNSENSIAEIGLFSERAFLEILKTNNVNRNLIINVF